MCPRPGPGVASPPPPEDPEDWDEEVRGGPKDSLSSNTELGRAVRGACDELENLAALDRSNMQKAAELLEGFGIKMKAPPTGEAEDAPEYFFHDDEEGEDAGDA